jgi:probable non-F420 flavinoid oxidoreductase
MDIGYHASHEQFPPSFMLQMAHAAERHGFRAISSSDHLAPWSTTQNHSGYTFTWLGGAMATTRLPYAVVHAPGQRHHPVMSAQALGTLAEMFPGRITPFLGSGQALNEHVTGDVWPVKAVRNARLAECADIMRRLLAGETVTHDGLVRVRTASLYSLPETPPPLMAAALTPKSAGHVAAWADGLITLHGPPDTVKPVLDTFRDVAGDKPISVQIHISWRQTMQEAEADAMDQWKSNALPPILNEELELPEQFDAASAHMDIDDLRDSVVITDSAQELIDILSGYVDLGIDRVFVHQVGLDQEAFIMRAGEELLPHLHGTD